MTELKNIEEEYDFSNTACIVYPAEFPSHITGPTVSRPHSTILYLGDINEDLGGTEIEHLMDILSPVETNYYQYIEVTGKALFGPDADYPVLTLSKTPILEEIHSVIKNTLLNYGIVSPSQWDYAPHMTVDAETYNRDYLPEWVLLRPPVLWYRDESVLIGSTRRSYGVGGPPDKYPMF